MRRATRRSRRARRSPTTAPRATPPAGTVARGWLRDDEALYTGKVDGAAGRRVPVRDRPRRTGARPAALQHLLHAVPRPARRRQRHGGAARPAPGGLVSPGSPAPGEARLLLRRDHQRLRRHAGLRGTDSGPRSLADRRLRAHAAIEPARVGRRRAGGSPRRARRRRRRRGAGRPAAATAASRRRNTSVDSDSDFGNLHGRPARRCRACSSSA